MNPQYLTTSNAARYCGYKNSEGLRKARRSGKVHPVGRRGGDGPWMWDVAELDAFLRGVLLWGSRKMRRRRLPGWVKGKHAA